MTRTSASKTNTADQTTVASDLKARKKNPIFLPDNLSFSQHALWAFAVAAIFVTGGFLHITGHSRSEPLPPPPDNAVYKQADAPLETRVYDLLSRMTLEEKIGQMALVEKNSLRNLDDTANYTIGAVLSGAGAKPDNNTPEGWYDMVTGYQEAAMRSRLKIPVLYGIDANHGHANIPGATVFPHFIGLGASGDDDLVRRVAQATAEELSDSNINWSYSPTFDAPKDIRWGRMYEAFSDDPNVTARLGQAYINGLQENPDDPASKDIYVLATAKHYLGTGAMIWGKSDNKSFKIDQGKVEANEDLLNNEYLPPYAAAAEAGVSSVMIGLEKYGDERIIQSNYLVTQKLKNEAGFRGFVVSDWYGVYERAGNRYKATVKAINAGVDMAMLPFDYSTFVGDVKSAVQRGDIKEARIDDAVARILRQKFQAGLFEKPFKTTEDSTTIGAAEHRAVAREAVAKSSVLLKNDAATLPLAKTGNTIFVAGSGADNVGRQSGAWTVEWQGIEGNWLPGSTSILKGIRDHVDASTSVNYDLKANFTGRAKVGIAVVSEKPYAEGWGDNPNPTLSSEDLQTIERLKKVSDKVVVVIVSGRPLLIENERSTWDALIASWLPGSEGAGVADVLFGDVKFSGKLPLPWPARISQLPIASNGTTADGSAVAFPRGYGLTAQ